VHTAISSCAMSMRTLKAKRLGAVCGGGYGIGLPRAADRAFPEGGDCGKGLAGVVAESVEHVCRKSAPGLRGGASGRTGDAGVGQDQQMQVS
jgi:hypothetical protein